MEKCCICNGKAVKKLIVEPDFGQIYVCDDIGCNDKIKRDINNCYGDISTKNNKKMKRFYRKSGMLGGVCSGIAEYVGIDVLFIRLGFIFIPGTLGPYLLLWLIGPHISKINK
jgi:phage shock protein PspC (stress-responsive transcriptional regulator)